MNCSVLVTGELAVREVSGTIADTHALFGSQTFLPSYNQTWKKVNG